VHTAGLPAVRRGAGLVGVPVHGYPGEPQPADRVGQRGVAGGLLGLAGDRRDDQRPAFDPAVRVGAQHRAQRLPRPDLNERDVRQGERGAEAVGEPHRAAHVPGPVLRVGGLFAGHQRAGDVREVRQGRRP
jgi:hypothetical protein